jgi:hypothetical protein
MAYLDSYPMGTVGDFRSGEADHSPPPSADVKNRGALDLLSHMPSWRSA